MKVFKGLFHFLMKISFHLCGVHDGGVAVESAVHHGQGLDVALCVGGKVHVELGAPSHVGIHQKVTLLHGGSSVARRKRLLVNLNN